MMRAKTQSSFGSKRPARGAEFAGPYTLMRFELNCGATRLRALSRANYDSSGTLTQTREGGAWQSIIPDTLGEALYNGA